MLTLLSSFFARSGNKKKGVFYARKLSKIPIIKSHPTELFCHRTRFSMTKNTAPECLPDLFSGAGCDGAVRAVWKRYLGEAGADGSVLYADRSGGSRRRRMGDGNGAGILFLCNRKFRH